MSDHLGQAEFSLTVVANFACLKGTPALEAVQAALARIGEAKAWVGHNLAAAPRLSPVRPAKISARESHRIVTRRVGRLAP